MNTHVKVVEGVLSRARVSTRHRVRFLVSLPVHTEVGGAAHQQGGGHGYQTDARLAFRGTEFTLGGQQGQGTRRHARTHAHMRT